MKLRDKILYMSYGAGLVVLGMVLNSLIADANADKGSIDAKFGRVTCREIVIEDDIEVYGRMLVRGSLSVSGPHGMTVVDEHDRWISLHGGTIRASTYEISKLTNVSGYITFGRFTNGQEFGTAPRIELFAQGKTIWEELGEPIPENKKVYPEEDKRGVYITVDENGGRLDAFNKLGENVAIIGVGNKGGGVLDLRDKHGYKY